jgi:histidinol-phosphate/aromatic aminotransferase/cobyric acid decarboxylase-like protein
VLYDDVRLYHPAEVRALLDRAGFAVAAVDADFTPGAPVTVDTRYVQFVARPAPVPESALRGHRAPAPPGVLDLRSAPDEVELVADGIAAAWAALGRDGPPLAERARRYDLADPYGGGRAAPVLGAPAERITAGAGATGLLHGLARLADGGSVLMDPAGHTELAGAAAAGGGRIHTTPLTGPQAAIAAVRRHRPAVTVLDRPALVGPLWTLDAVGALATAVAAAGGVLVVDETCGGYLPPGSSCAPLTEHAPGLVVVRSMSKGYCCGGLRVGFAVCSPHLAATVRQVLLPLAASALALDVSLALLTLPDPLAALRARIAGVKPGVAAALARTGLSLIDTDPHVPWLVLPGDAETRAELAARRLLAKDVPVLDAETALLRLSVPLSAHRLAAFHNTVQPETVSR